MFYSYSRTALKLILKNLMNKDQNKYELLVPDFICSGITNHLLDMKIKILFYNINENLNIDWHQIKKLINPKKTIAFLCVNYFGFPLSIIDAVKFCREHDLILIEDNSHGYKGLFENKELGTFGNYGFSSPRKHLPLRYGGVLHNNTHNVIHNNLNVHYYNNSIDIIKYYINNYFLNFKLFVLKNYKYKNIQNNHEEIINLKDSKLDDFSKNIIINTDWNKLRKNKMENYINWSIYLDQNNIFNFNHNTLTEFKSVNPWCYPMLVDSERQLIDLLKWSKNEKIISFNWPCLPKEISKSTIAYDYSQKLVCFSTYKSLLRNN